MGMFLILTMGALFALRRRRGHSFGQLPRAVVFGVFAAAIGIGAFGVEIPGALITVRALVAAEIAADVRTTIGEQGRPVVALITERNSGLGRFVMLRVLADDGDGLLVDAEPCGGFDFPTEVGVDPNVVAGLFCFPSDLDPTMTIRVAEGQNNLGVPIAAPLLN